MNTRSTTRLIAVVSALAFGALNSVSGKAETTGNTGSLVYNNRAYMQDIGYGPNPAPAQTIQDAEIVFVSNAYGPAIYSYPNNVGNQVTAFNVEYVNTAYGQAIYGYPNNNPKHHLELVDNAVDVGEGAIVPVTFTTGIATVNTTGFNR
jgi:hypothetical protein